MLAGVWGKALRDRWRGTAITVLSLSTLLYFAMAVYRDLDLNIYADLPVSMQSLIGIPEEADVAALAYSAIYNSYGALALGGVAIAIGSAAVAGEERAGTLSLLLGNPRSRSHVLVSKAAAMLVLVVAAGLALWGAGVLAPVLLDVDVTGLHVGAYTLHLTVSTLLYGFLALALGSSTGRTAAAAGGATGVMVVSFLAAGLLPTVEGLAPAAKAFPWYYLSGSDPLLGGVDWAHLAVLAGASAGLFVAAVLGVNRRDLRNRAAGTSLLDRARALPATSRVADLLAGSARVSRIWVKSASEHQALLAVVSAAMVVVMGALMGPIYRSLDQALLDLGDVLPESMLAFFGGGNLSTPEGFYRIESFGLVAPIAVMVVVIALGAKALAGEEADRTMGLLLANPVPRSRVLAEKALTMLLYGVAVGLATFAGVVAGNALGSMGMDLSHVAAACLLLTLIGLVFGALALLVGAATGRVRTAVLVPAAAALVLHVVNALGDLNDAWWARVSPFYYYLGGDPLTRGLEWGHAAVLAGLTAVLLGLAFPAFARRDLRQHS